MKVLTERRCGNVKQGALYAHCDRDRFGTLWPLVALFAPIRAEIANPRSQEEVNVPETIHECFGLRNHRSDSRWGLPLWGLADQWGSTYYPTPWDVMQEILEMGVNRRMNKSLVKRIMTTQTFPFPMLVMHKSGGLVLPTEQTDLLGLHSRPWLLGAYPDDAPLWKGMGHTDYTNNLNHPLLEYYKQWAKSGPKWPGKHGYRTYPAVIGLTPITSIRYTLKDNEEEVPEDLKELGVLPALSNVDRRAV